MIQEICGRDDVVLDLDENDVDLVTDDRCGGNKKRKFQHPIDDKEDYLPFKYRHVRSGLRSVRPEIYEVIHTLQSEYHLSHRQAEAAIITVANKLFGREHFGESKMYKPNSVCDVNIHSFIYSFLIKKTYILKQYTNKYSTDTDDKIYIL